MVVMLPPPMAGQNLDMFPIPPVGTLVDVAFTEGRPDKPFIRQTLAQGNRLPDVKPVDQSQPQREAVCQRNRVGTENRPDDPRITACPKIQADGKTLEVVPELAPQTAACRHSNAGAISAAGTNSGQLKTQHAPMIG